ncbi:MAG: hypothetical protein ACLTDV_01700 [Eubacterium sp.]
MMDAVETAVERMGENAYIENIKSTGNATWTPTNWFITAYRNNTFW